MSSRPANDPRYPHSSPDGSRSNRQQVSSPKTKRLTQKDIDSSAHRLSRVPQKFGTSKAIQSEKAESYAVTFFRNHPEAIDTRPPNEKLDDIEGQLGADLEPSQHFTLLIQQKSLRYIVFGENSKEALDSHANLGKFYNSQHRPTSALRHLQRAHALEDSVEIDSELQALIAVETADAHLSLRSEKKGEGKSHVDAAAKAIHPVADFELENKELTFKREILLGRICVARQQYSNALSHYKSAKKLVDASPEKAQTYVEMAECCESSGDKRKAGKYYKKAYQMYLDLGMPESAKQLEPKLPTSEENSENDQDDQIDQNDQVAERNVIAEPVPEPEPESEPPKDTEHSSSESSSDSEHEKEPEPEPEPEPEKEAQPEQSPEPEPEKSASSSESETDKSDSENENVNMKKEEEAKKENDDFMSTSDIQQPDKKEEEEKKEAESTETDNIISESDKEPEKEKQPETEGEGKLEATFGMLTGALMGDAPEGENQDGKQIDDDFESTQ